MVLTPPPHIPIPPLHFTSLHFTPNLTPRVSLLVSLHLPFTVLRSWRLSFLFFCPTLLGGGPWLALGFLFKQGKQRNPLALTAISICTSNSLSPRWPASIHFVFFCIRPPTFPPRFAAKYIQYPRERERRGSSIIGACVFFFLFLFCCCCSCKLEVNQAGKPKKRTRCQHMPQTAWLLNWYAPNTTTRLETGRRKEKACPAFVRPFFFFFWDTARISLWGWGPLLFACDVGKTNIQLQIPSPSLPRLSSPSRYVHTVLRIVSTYLRLPLQWESFLVVRAAACLPAYW